MRGKRSKQYRKLMQQYGLNFGFREPYQVLVDADVLRDADRFKMDLVGGLERTLHGQVKPSAVITQCSMRHLYAAATEPGVSYLIDKAKTYERRRCGHHPDDHPTPLSAKECLASVIDPKDSKTNKHRYVVASQEQEVRKHMRGVLGVPLIYINRSIMIMEPMAGATSENRDREERGKFRAGLKRGSGSLKRKREDNDNGEDEGEGHAEAGKPRKKAVKGPKGPNPLSVKKPKKKSTEEGDATRRDGIKIEAPGEASAEQGDADSGVKRKRRRKHKSGANKGEEAEPELKVE
ncbi:rRNA-processing protein utp23 [Lachnellula arida]|uniref:U three protein 23 n=1 Tax=Lachnellula arida TaxID=1316785 RepID=A0A8T9BKE4_9HELO|nr:rRNA-processing protein utp23 [Lachnellula arida]